MFVHVVISVGHQWRRRWCQAAAKEAEEPLGCGQ